jgi:hypothetical protein
MRQRRSRPCMRGKHGVWGEYECGAWVLNRTGLATLTFARAQALLAFESGINRTYLSAVERRAEMAIDAARITKAPICQRLAAAPRAQTQKPAQDTRTFATASADLPLCRRQITMGCSSPDRLLRLPVLAALGSVVTTVFFDIPTASLHRSNH